MRCVAPALALAASLIASSASARDWPNTAGWHIAEGEDSCGAVQEYEGDGATQLVMILQVDGRVGLSLTNTNWSSKEGQEYKLSWVLNGSSYGGASYGYSSGYRNGFLGRFGAEVLPDLRLGGSLRVYRDEQLVDQLSLAGSAAAIAMVERCVAHVRSERAVEAREKARFAHIPKDPFATDNQPTNPPAPLPISQAATPLGDPAKWTTGDTYPPAALRAGASGTARAKLIVGKDGRVSGCSIAHSTGNLDLDTTTCRLMRTRARFAPAKDAGGYAVESTYEVDVPWRLPEG